MVRRYVQASFALLLACSFLFTPNTFAKGGGGFRGGGRSFSGGSRPGGFSSSRSFSTPGTPPPSRGTFKPAGGFTTRYDSGAASAQRAQSSRSLYEHANGIFNGGRPSTAERVGPVTRETIDTRPSRQQSVFNRYTTQPVTVVYHDSFNPFFWMWLMTGVSATGTCGSTTIVTKWTRLGTMISSKKMPPSKTDCTTLSSRASSEIHPIRLQASTRILCTTTTMCSKRIRKTVRIPAGDCFSPLGQGLPAPT